MVDGPDVALKLNIDAMHIAKEYLACERCMTFMRADGSVYRCGCRALPFEAWEALAVEAGYVGAVPRKRRLDAAAADRPHKMRY